MGVSLPYPRPRGATTGGAAPESSTERRPRRLPNGPLPRAPSRSGFRRSDRAAMWSAIADRNCRSRNRDRSPAMGRRASRQSGPNSAAGRSCPTPRRLRSGRRNGRAGPTGREAPATRSAPRTSHSRRRRRRAHKACRLRDEGSTGRIRRPSRPSPAAYRDAHRAARYPRPRPADRSR